MNSVRSDIVRHLKEDTEAFSTLMVDYYGMPATGNRAWPGRQTQPGLDSLSKALILETALVQDVALTYGSNFDQRRFVPFVLMHEFEGLLFSDCEAFANGIGCNNLTNSLSEIRMQFPTPEDINDSPQTAPSKRIEGVVLDYEKQLHGILAILEIGLETIRSECPHFNQWLENLETRVP